MITFRRKIVIAAITVLFLAGAAVFVINQPDRPDRPSNTVTIDGVTLPARAGKAYLQVPGNNSWHDLLLKGVNMGMAKPGHFPGEAAITKREYARWFKSIGAMNANVIRVYTLHPPEFYEALSEYNAKAEQPLYLLHGVWINEEKLLSTGDVYMKDLSREFVQDIRRTVDVIHGNADLPARPGHASGKYRADVADYVIGWVLGVEWNPEAVHSTNKKHEGTPDFNGRYFQTKQASPFESWLAGMMDEVAAYETDHYKWQRPMSFTNWVTTDLLKHPSEPFLTEDLVSINPNVIRTKPAFHGGAFASYHVYPYYPEFLNYETKYTDYVDFRGEKNSYAGYLHDLKRVHGMPVLIAEFGVPASRGITHRNVHGYDQGFHTEQEQGAIVARLYKNIVREGLAGGLIFTWQDEWFKRTWNTADLDNPDRRPFWSNAQTGEQQFGLLSFDPGPVETSLYADGMADDWKKAGVDPAKMETSGPVRTLDEDDGLRAINQWFVSSDARYVYFRIDFAKDVRPFDWSKGSILLLLDTIPGQGQHRIPGGSGLTTDAGIDFAIDLKGPGRQSRMWVDSYYDPFYYEYGPRLNMLPVVDYANRKNNGIFHKINLALNRPLDIPNVRGKTIHLPLDKFETGLLRSGNGNPNSPDYDSLTDVAYNDKEHRVEVRIPWQLLNVKDPSTREIMSDLWKKGLQGGEKTSGFKIALLSYRPNGSDRADAPGGPDISYSVPGTVSGTLSAKDMFTYEWSEWETPEYHERLKKSYYMMKDLFSTQMK
ncbi:hypothetical protein [Paenibacillus beijingensis]|uniref:hypothetical protein n=1 Tax=Paenibacillus beijingensis TaxID=1126833 RepID=UPI000695C5CF|nr:hypothetical protein [Paenibacillus beijingensis]